MKPSAKIMVVDDEQRICENVEKILSDNKYTIVTAASAQEALDKLARESFFLLISDIVMPGMDGLQLLKLVKSQWPLTKAVMMTAYASTDTAAKAIRLGALDYIPKPFTPSELRATVERALAGELVEASVSVKEKDAIPVADDDRSAQRGRIDTDIPFSRAEVGQYTGEDYVDSLGPSDMPVVTVPSEDRPLGFCSLGEMVCPIFKKLKTRCKEGLKTGECPRKKAMAKRAAAKKERFDADMLIGIDLPFNYDEVASVTGPEYLMDLNRDGFAFVPYEELKRRVLGRPEQTVRKARPETAAKADRAKKVLVVDDEVAVNNNIRKILSKKGYDVDQAISKEEALDRIAVRSYALILLDLRMPGVKGLELLQCIKDQQQEARVIIITGYAGIDTAVETARLGAVDYLAKPFTPDEIRIAADRAMHLAA
jgi:DNA-binding response OmpR family regulator